MTGEREHRGITLADGVTGGQVLSAFMRQAATDFPEAFAGLALPSEQAAFKARYAELLPAFEALRVQSGQAAEIARAACFAAAAQLRFEDAAGERALPEALRERVPPRALVRVDLPGTRRLRPSVDYAGKLYVGRELTSLGEQLAASRFATDAAVSALTQVGQWSEQSSGLSLSGERFVLLGAGAELSPVYTLLEAGAEVLWLDRKNPPIDRLLQPRLGGALSYVDHGVDLLREPAAVRATILEFARGGPVHLGLYAFAPGHSCPLRLALSMNELVCSLPGELIKSLAFLLSPTSVNFIYPEDAARADQRAEQTSKVRRALLRTGPLSVGHVMAGAQRVSSSVVSQQGAAYQVAEYMGKRLAAEAFFAFGSALDGSEVSSLSVSANMAPVSRTRSLEGPLLQAAALGAPSFDMMIAPASTARAVSALLTVHDVLEPVRENLRAQSADLTDAGAAGASALFAQQFHGGIYAQPYALDGIIRMSAFKAIARRPKLAFGLLR